MRATLNTSSVRMNDFFNPIVPLNVLKYCFFFLVDYLHDQRYVTKLPDGSSTEDLRGNV